MTVPQALVSAAVTFVIALAILLEWFTLPASLGAAPSHSMSVTASHRPGKGGHARLSGRSGFHAEVPCGRVRPLCVRLEGGAARAIEVRLVRVGLTADPWLLSARMDDEELLAPQAQARAFDRSKASHLGLASMFLLATAIFAGYACFARRALVQ